jgi:hypothetical protein
MTTPQRYGWRRSLIRDPQRVGINEADVSRDEVVDGRDVCQWLGFSRSVGWFPVDFDQAVSGLLPTFFDNSNEFL